MHCAPSHPVQDIRQQYDKISSVMQMDSQALLSDAKTAIEEVRHRSGLSAIWQLGLREGAPVEDACC